MFCVLARVRDGAARAVMDLTRALDAREPNARAVALDRVREEDGFWLPVIDYGVGFDASAREQGHAFAVEACGTTCASDVLAVPVKVEALEAVRRGLKAGGTAHAAALRVGGDFGTRERSGVGRGGKSDRSREAVKVVDVCEVGNEARALFGEDASARVARVVDFRDERRVAEVLRGDAWDRCACKVVNYVENCAEEWSIARVRELCDAERVVDVHVCPHETVDLAGHRAPGTRRNFEFRKMAFGEFFDRVENAAGASSLQPVIERGERYYLRSVDGNAATDLRRTHPELASALSLSPVWPERDFHSSVLRISSANTTLWTHYDTHDNMLVQIVGSKTVTLFPPEADPYMYVQGSSSRVENVTSEPSDEDLRDFPLFYAHASRSRSTVHLGPGDALFIPAFWFHHVVSSDDGSPSVAVNVFWRDCALVNRQEYDVKDIYGNKELNSGKEACELAARAGEALRDLREPFKSFYARRAVRLLAAQVGARLSVEL